MLNLSGRTKENRAHAREIAARRLHPGRARQPTGSSAASPRDGEVGGY